MYTPPLRGLYVAHRGTCVALSRPPTRVSMRDTGRCRSSYLAIGMNTTEFLLLAVLNKDADPLRVSLISEDKLEQLLDGALCPGVYLQHSPQAFLHD